MAVFSVSRVESQIGSRFVFVLVRVISWIVSAQKNTIHETTRNNTKRYFFAITGFKIYIIEIAE